MRVCAAQISPIAGDVATNLRKHAALVELAVAHDADLVLFPELSLTGYEPTLARVLAMAEDDPRLDDLQSLSDASGIVIGIGVPTAAAAGVRIGMLIMQPHRGRLTYCKQLLHADELPYFTHGDEQIVIEVGGHRVAPAICYESLQPVHAETAAKLGAGVYLASVAKGGEQLREANAHYPAIARQHSMIVLMANCFGQCDGFMSVGQSSIWNEEGEIVAKMDAMREGLVLFDTATRRARVMSLPSC